MERFKIDEYVVRGKGRDYSVLVFPVDKYMWAYDNRWEIDHYCVDGSKEAFNLLKYAMAILANASDKIIYFPCKQSGIGDHYNENYNLILCTPKAQLRRSSWISIRRKLGPATKKGSFVLQYDRKKLDDYCRKKLMRKYCENLKIKYRLNAVAGNAIEKW